MARLEQLDEASNATSTTLGKWFWGETAAAKVLFLLQARWKESTDPRPAGVQPAAFDPARLSGRLTL